MRQEKAAVVISDQGRQDLTTLDRLDVFFGAKTNGLRGRSGCNHPTGVSLRFCKKNVQQVRIDRIKQAQDNKLRYIIWRRI